MSKLRIVLLVGLVGTALTTAAPPASACSVDGPVNLCILEEPCSIGEDVKPEKLGCHD